MQYRYMPEIKWRAAPKDLKTPKASYTRAFSLLRYELSRIKATDVILEAGFRLDQLRNDGQPYLNAKPEHSSCRLSFKKGGKTPLSFECGSFSAFHVNVYLIAMTLERLRAVERYGCTQGDQQYRGWSQLPPSGGGGIQTAEWASKEDALQFLADVAGNVDDVYLPDLPHVYRDAARKAHPDAGGSNELMSKVNRARDFIAA